MVSIRTLNVIMLSVAFMLVFVSFQTMANILVTIVASMKINVKDYTADPFIGLAIIYIVLALSNFVAPSIISVLGPRLSMICGGFMYTLYTASFFITQSWVLYVASAVLGFGAAIIWTGQGTYLTQNSDDLTIGRNSGIFWAVFQCSQLLGNAYIYFVFTGKTEIDPSTRVLILIVLTCVSLTGITLLVLLRPAVTDDGVEIENRTGPLQAMKYSFSLITEGRMLLLCFTFCFTGVLLTFAGSLYGNAIGFTKQLGGDTKRLVGLHGVLFGLGEVVGGVVFGMLGERTVRWGRNPIIVAGCVAFTACFALIYLNIPNAALDKDTEDMSIIKPPLIWIALLCSFLLGFGDSCFNTQIYSIIGTLYKDDSAPAFAMFKFTQSVATGLGFVYTKYLGLYGSLAVLTGMLYLSTVTFVLVERIAARVQRESQRRDE